MVMIMKYKKPKILIYSTLLLFVCMIDTHHIYADTIHMDLFYQDKNHVYEAEAVTICIDGKPLTAKDMPAIIIDERTMLPMRLIAEALDAEVAWNEDANQVYVINDTNTIVFQIDDKTGYQNGNTFTIDVPPKMTSKKLSEILQQHIVTATGNINRNTKHWETVLILNQTTVPTALIEVGFLTNPGDALKISNPEYQDTVAQAIADGIQEAMQYPLR